MSIYGSKAWRQKRAAQLEQEPFCRLCEQAGFITRATVADHIEPHRWDMDKFWNGELQSLCKLCHDSVKQSQERTGVLRGHDLSGWPLDKTHQAYTGRVKEHKSIKHETYWPLDIEHSAIPLTIVCGPPAAGKSTYVREHAQLTDTVIDIGIYLLQLGASEWDSRTSYVDKALKHRNEALRSLSTAKQGRAWFITGAPQAEQRSRWRHLLKPKDIVLLDPGQDECIARVRRDPQRTGQEDAVNRWYQQYSPGQWDFHYSIDGHSNVAVC